MQSTVTFQTWNIWISELRIFAKVQVRAGMLFVSNLVGWGAEKRYYSKDDSIDLMGKGPVKGGALVNSDQSEAFHSVDNRYTEAVLQGIGLVPSFWSWITAMNIDIGSVVLVNGFLSRTLAIDSLVRQICPFLHLWMCGGLNHCCGTWFYVRVIRMICVTGEERRRTRMMSPSSRLQ